MIRDDGDRGVALSFEALEPGQAARIAQIVRDLPPLERLDESERSSETVVPARVLPTLLRQKQHT